ncbi:MAG: L-threonylcarbamoyladenylate synthase [Hyphomicrobiaceae bacterium]
MTIFAATTDAIERAAGVIRGGGIVAMPTETVYGLAGDATNGRAVASVYAAKGRPSFNPLIVHVGTIAAARTVADLGETGEQLAAAFWPGPLTLVARARPGNGIASLVTAGLETVAVRVPGHGVAQALLAACGCPLAAPSANTSGRISPTTAQHVAADFGDRLGMILDGGACGHGLESTIVDVSGDGVALLRPGAIAADEIERVAGFALARRAVDKSAPSAPGQLASHYAPRAGVRLGARSVEPGEALLAFGSDVPETAGPVFNLSVTGDLVEAAQNLFAALHALDVSGAQTIAVMPVPAEGLGEAINDRLARAAAPR